MKNILVTGVSRGLGYHITEKLLLNGDNVYGIYRSMTPDLKNLSEKFSDSLHLLSFDLSNTNEIKNKIFNEFLGFDTILHGFVNNAAIAYDDLSTNANINELENMFQVNVITPIILTKFVIRNMLLHSTKGSIVHISSISVHTGYKGLSMYAATKGALEAFSKNIAREWGEKVIRSNCIVAGFMETDMSSKLSDEQKERIYNRTSLKQQVSIDSVVETILFLLSDKSFSITGQNIFVDNGTI